MPIVIAREGAAEPHTTALLPPQQREELWAAVVRGWVQRHPDTFAAMLSGKQDIAEAAHG